MLYGFRHYPTPSGRRIECTIGRDEYERAIPRVAPGFFDGVARRDVGDDVQLTMTVAAAIRLTEALANVGGDASVVARMLGEQLDAMVTELRVLHFGGPGATAARSQFQRAVGF